MVSFIRKYQLVENWKTYFAILWPLALLPIKIIGDSVTANCAYAVAILAGFWMTEAIPIPITSLLPMFLYPIMGIQTPDVLAREYLKDSILIFVGGLMIALAFEYCGLHKRIALRVILFTGTSVKMLMLGIMLCTMSLSMWMSNTAVSAMMVPIIMAVLEELEISLKEAYKQDQLKNANLKEGYAVEHEPIGQSTDTLSTSCSTKSTSQEDISEICESNVVCSEGSGITSKCDSRRVSFKIEGTLLERRVSEGQIKISGFMKNTRTMFLLSCCYASNIGGTGVITGSGTNLVAVEFLGNLDPKNHGDYASLTFTTWMAFNILPMLLNITIAWIYLQVSFLGIPEHLKFWKKTEDGIELKITPTIEAKIKEMLQKAYIDLGSVTAHEKGVAVCFLIAVTSFILHDPKFIPGWKDLFPKEVSISTSALAVSVLFFMIPRNEEFYTALRSRDFKGVTFKPLLEWSFVQKKFPWGVVILLGGGYAMSSGAKKAGLSTWIGQSLKALASLPPKGILGIICVMIAFLTEIASNTATATIVLPILLELSKELNIHPLYLTLPATIVCSYAFMLPVATPPNAIVYAASDMKVTDMIKTGFFMNCSCVLVLYLSTISYGNLIFRFDEYQYVP
ncbi:unnamed protein product [Allacma fusca]|uniref:Solute carrier family 13 member 5 n=1 Tax=Allacma fusca TaxID=39272 RepID=A0A8J2KS73_9HEXA|nr:unnamed protein product [Allacma fusca]